MEYSLLRFLHVLGAVLIGGGLIGVWLSDLRSRQLRELRGFAEAVRNIVVFYDGVVVPGALLLLASGTWIIAQYYGGWTFVRTPWLTGMVILFGFEFVERNTVTRLYFMRLRRLTRTAMAEGRMTLELQRARGEMVPTFTHFLDLPLLRHHCPRHDATGDVVGVPIGFGRGVAAGDRPHLGDSKALSLALNEMATHTH